MTLATRLISLIARKIVLATPDVVAIFEDALDELTAIVTRAVLNILQ